MSGVRTLFLFLFLICAQTIVPPHAAQAAGKGDHVDLLLVLAIDVSASVSGEKVDTKEKTNEIMIQRRGIAAALRSPEVATRLKHCNPEGIAITMVEWSGRPNEKQVVQILPWRKVKNEQDLESMAQFIEHRTGRSFEHSTDIATALTESLRFLDEAPFTSERRIISISSDGDQGRVYQEASSDPNIVNKHLLVARDKVLAMGVTIDAIVLMTDRSGVMTKLPLDEYYNEFVIGGSGGTAHGIYDFQEYGQALEMTLSRELNNCRI